MQPITSLIEGATEVVTAFAQVLTESVGAITSIFYTTGTDGGLTIVGGAMAMALGVGVVYLLFRLVRGLVKQNERG